MKRGGAEGGATVRWPRSLLTLSLLLLMLLAAGCRTAFIGRAERDYTEGRYLEVAEELARHEEDLHTIPRTKQARYGLYRGLALLKLGDYEGAGQWFTFVRDVERAGPTLNPERLALLDAGEKELLKMKQLQSGSAPPPPEP